MKILINRLLLNLALLAIAGASVCQAKSKLPENTPVPDLTKVVIADLSHTYHLGPTGARGWIHKISSYATPDDFEGYFTNTDARQILVTAVEEGSPADGVLAVGDVILGTGNDHFTGDARKAFADAIDDAEKEENKGVLRLLRWRPDTPDQEGATGRSKGKSDWVDLQLQVMGTYSDTAPYDCPKSKAIVDQTAALIFNGKKTDRLHIAALGLLATGEEKYIAAVRDYIHGKGLANPKMKLTVETARGSSSWSWSYAAILLGEYHLLTGDKDVLPALETYAVTIAMGQSIAGNWGHKMADYAYNDGRAHGRLTGYGALNVVGIPCFMALNLAERCGIRHPELTRAIARAGDFFGYFAGKGAIPYGHDHPLEYMVTNNGMCGSAAIAFALRGDQDRAGFFSRLCAAAHTKTEVGHTGTFFGTFWTPLGANLAGPDTCAAFFREHRWIHTLARKWNGGFVYQAPGGRFGGSSESYSGLSSDAAHLIFYATPRRKLAITGRDADRSIWLKGDAARDAVAAGVLDYGSRSDTQLLALLEHPVPMVRRKAADELGTRKGDFVGPLRSMLAGGNRDARVGAVHGLAALRERAAPAIDDLVAVIGNPKEELWLRNRALLALPAIGKPAGKALNALLKISLADKPEDPRGDLDKEIALTLSRLVEDPYTLELDKALFYPAVTKLLDNPHHVSRTAAMKLIRNIPLEDFHLMADKILHVIRNTDLRYQTYHHDAARGAGLAILVRLHIRDGIDLCLETLETNIWGQKWRVYGENGRLATLASYGADAKRVLPQLKEMRESRRIGDAADPFLEAIEQSTGTRKLISLEEAVRAGREQDNDANPSTGTDDLEAVSATPPPNVLLLTADDLNYDSIGCYGCEIPNITPNLDRLAKGGLKFNHAHVNIAVCQPCRQSIMTGRYPHRNGAEGFDPIDEAVPTLQERLRAAGYLNGILGKEKHLKPMHRYCWDLCVKEGDLSSGAGIGRSPEKYHRYSREFLDLAREQKKPFFLMANMHDPHRPFAGSAQELRSWGRDLPTIRRRIREEDVSVPEFLAELPDVRKEIAEYYTSVYRCDEVVGAVLKALEESGFADNTLVMFLSDNGIAVPFAKANCYLNSTKTPWIVSWPGKVKAGTVDSKHLVSGIDYMPTILEALGLEMVDGMDGRSFLPLLRGEPQAGRDHAFTEFHKTYARRCFPMRAVQGSRFGYIVNFWADRTKPMRMDSTSGLTFRTMKEAGESDPKIAARVKLFEHRVLEEFFDFEKDPDGLSNLIANPEYQDEIENMRELLRKRMARTNDPAQAVFDNLDSPAALDEFMEAQRARAKRAKKSAPP